MSDTSPLFCGVCGAANNRANKFCTQCGNSMDFATPAELPTTARPDLANLPTNLAQPTPPPALAVKQRGGCLTTYLLLTAFSGVVTMLLFFFTPATRQTLQRDLAFFALVGGGIGNLATVIGLWRWKKWGFTVYVVTNILQVIVGLWAGWSWLMILPVIGSIAILYTLLQPKWQFLE